MAKGKPPELGMVMLLGSRCRCGHEWLPRARDKEGDVERPTVCPKCKSPRWDKPKRE
jgi:transcriptional regulator